MELLLRHEPRKADVIVLLAGDRFHRVAKAAALYHEGYAPVIVLTSSADNWDYGSLPSSRLVSELLKLGVKEEDIVWEETASHTRAEADATLKLAETHGWKTLLLVTTEYHQYRAFLTWLKAMEDRGVKHTLNVASVREFPDFYDKTHDEALRQEFEKIEEYCNKGDVATYRQGLWYLLEQ